MMLDTGESKPGKTPKELKLKISKDDDDEHEEEEEEEGKEDEEY
jgi:hypothetical protein